MQGHPFYSSSKSGKGFALIPLRILRAVAAAIAVSMRLGEEPAHNDHSAGSPDGWFGESSGPASVDLRGL